MTDLLLIRPYSKWHVEPPPLGLMSLQAYLRQEGFDVRLWDERLNGRLWEQTRRMKIRISSFPEWIGISGFSCQHNEMVRKASMAEEIGYKLMIGGNHISALPELLCQMGSNSVAVIGEGEVTAKELLKGKDFVKGTAVRLGNSDIINIRPGRTLIKDLDALPFPDWSDWPMKYSRARSKLLRNRAEPVGVIQTSRGCNYYCKFCATNVIWRRHLRMQSPRRVIDEMLYLKELGAKEIHIQDDNFTANKGRVLEICNEMGDQVKLPWRLPNGVRAENLMDKEVVRSMAESGCYMVGIGIESGNQNILNDMNKALDLRVVPKAVKMLKKYRIKSYGFFMLGLPGETQATVKQTLRFALSLKLDRTWFGIFSPYPGTEFYDDQPFYKLNAMTPCGTCDIPDKTLKRLQRYCNFRMLL